MHNYILLYETPSYQGIYRDVAKFHAPGQYHEILVQKEERFC